jgi:hypothetical protein
LRRIYPKDTATWEAATIISRSRACEDRAQELLPTEAEACLEPTCQKRRKERYHLWTCMYH